ncbi:AtpZ/AtpI family protein [Jiella marina]|uniref:AtpZ/AtpI family protein n=1 Tax=Jiella sp. LLJ827 TaxID=2917712 RepID=UPI0021007B34|nr:AtpZ/AtpI family protein [Jiella sp. LLJ827]MCQ0989217.1 AtpZ/AtpI family protein [Jiella sp. LLJ827]
MPQERDGTGDEAVSSVPAAPEDPVLWDKRREELQRRLAIHRERNAAEEQRERKTGGTGQGIAEGLKLASEFAAGIIVGAAIGYFVDKLAGTTPFGLIFFLMIGFAAGIRNILRSVSPTTTSGQIRPKDDAGS